MTVVHEVRAKHLCTTCNGSGKLNDSEQPCPSCNGVGVIYKWVTFEQALAAAIRVPESLR